MPIDDIVRSLILGGLSRVPTVGWLSSSLLGALWPPSAEDIWAEIESSVEALIGQQLDAYTRQQVTEDLSGLRNVLEDYTTATTDSTAAPALISSNYIATRAQFDAIRPHFLSAGREVLLLPLMAQMANLHLGLLRDGVKFGKSWGWDDQAVADQETQLKARISDYTTWASTWYANGLNALSGGTWTQQNSYIRQMTLGVTDFAYYWPSFDPGANPGGAALPVPTREIYSDPIAYETDYPITVTPAPPLPLNYLSIVGVGFLDVVVGAQVGWGQESEPAAQTMGPQMGYLNPHTSNVPPLGWTDFIHSDNPIVSVGGSAGPGGLANGGWQSAWFQFQNGYKFTAGHQGLADTYAIHYPGHILSSLMVMSPDPNTGFNPDGVVYGFRFEGAYPGPY